MKMKVKFGVTLLVIAMTIAACGTGGAATPTPSVSLTATPAVATATAVPPTSTVPPTTAPVTETPEIPLPTLVVPTPVPPATAGPLPSGDLSDIQMASILNGSLADYPWRMNFHALGSAVDQVITGTITTQSSERLEMTIEEPVSGAPVIADIILITPTLYAKVSGFPSDVLQAAGLQDNQWAKVAREQDVLGVWSLAYAAEVPGDLLLSFGFQSLLTLSTTDQTPLKLTGTEQVGGVQTNVYQRQVTDPTGTFTYQVDVGTANGRIYAMQAHGPITTTVTIVYDQSISIQAPIP
jgi:hypothetical protein